MATLETLAMSFRKARATDSTDSSYPSKIPTQTEPSGGGVIDLVARIGSGGGSIIAQNAALIVPYATGADNGTFAIRVIGWRCIGEADRTTMLWIPVELVELACTMGQSAGVIGCTITNAQLFADTIALTLGDANDPGVVTHILSPANNAIAHATIDLEGFQKVEFLFQITSGPSAMNALIALI